jgi:hypothetical protein
MVARSDVPPACFYGCPEKAFKQSFQGLDQARNDFVIARGAGVSAVGCEVLAQHIESLKSGIQKHIDQIPEGNSGPWKVEFPASIDRQLNVGHQVECCQYGAYTLVGLQETLRARRPE